MNEPAAEMVATARGMFRVLSWPGDGTPVVLLHGLTAVAESWLPTVARLTTRRPIFVPDQRGHGRSTHETPDPSARAMADDVFALVDALGIERPHLAGHSMGARVAMVAAARAPERFRSVAIIDIGPEAWRQNWVDTVAALDRMRETMAPGEVEGIVERRQFDPETAAAFRARFEALPDGGSRPLGSREAMKRIVTNQRARNYWHEWESLRPPALLIRGETSDELRPRTAAEMRRRNPSVRFEEMPGSGHNIPLIDPAGLAARLEDFWESVP